jgi:hypothetical protein
MSLWGKIKGRRVNIHAAAFFISLAESDYRVSL